MQDIIEVITVAGSVCSAIVAVAGCLAFIFKWPTKLIRKGYEEHTEKIVDKKVDEVKDLISVTVMASIKKLEDREDINTEATLATLRHEITYAYEKYKKTKVLPGNTKKDLCSLYEVYTKMGGNSYVHEIYEEMMKWSTE